MSPVQINRDPFARASLMRERVPTQSCSWCGQPARFVYWWEQDGLHSPYPYRPLQRNRPVFCHVDCYRAYYN